MKTSIPKIVNVKFKPFSVLNVEQQYVSKDIKPYLQDALNEAGNTKYSGIVIALYDETDGGVYSSAYFASQYNLLKCIDIIKHRHVK